jgi:hypothetical protein
VTGKRRFAVKRSSKRGRPRISGAGRGGNSLVRRKKGAPAAAEPAGVISEASGRFCLGIEGSGKDLSRSVRRVA